MLTPYDVRREFSRGRSEQIAVVLVANFFGALFVGRVLSAATGAGWPVIFLAAITTALPLYRDHKRRHTRAATVGLNAAYRLITQGRLAEAEALLQEIESVTKAEWAARLIRIQRALISLKRGDLVGARAALDEAIAVRHDGEFKANSDYQVEGAHAMRAFVLAGLGEGELARADIDWIRALPNASPEALARVAVAEAIVLEKAGDKDGLRSLLDRERVLLFEHSHPRERAIVRAYQRMLKTTTRSVYRERAPETALSVDEPELDDWIERIAPGAAQFVRKGKKKRLADPAQVHLEQRKQQHIQTELQKAIDHSHYKQPLLHGANVPRNTSSSSQRQGVIIASIVGVIALLAGFSGLSSAFSPTHGSRAPSVSTPLAAVILGAAALGYAAYTTVKRVYRGKFQREHLASRSHNANPEDLEILTSGPDDVVAAQGHMIGALDAEARGNWLVVLEECDKGIARLWVPDSRKRADILFPDLHSLRAFALACMGRYSEAEQSLRWLSTNYPHYERAFFRVRLVELLQSVGPREAAHFVETQAMDLPISVREELLADLARVVGSMDPPGMGEVARLRDELDKIENGKQWIASVCPGLLNEFVGNRPQEGVRIDVSSASDSTHRTAEEEAEAELEAELTGRDVAYVR